MSRRVIGFAVLVLASACVQSDLTGSRCGPGGLCGDEYVCRLDGTCAKGCEAGQVPCDGRCVTGTRCAPATGDGGTDGGALDGGDLDAGRCPISGALVVSPRGGRLMPGEQSVAVRIAADGGPSCPLEYELELGTACANFFGGRCSAPVADGGLVFSGALLPLAVDGPPGRRYLRARACDAAHVDGCGAWSTVRVFEVGLTPGDMDGDGFADVLIGQRAGSPLVFFGSATGREALAVDAGVGTIRSLAALGDHDEDLLGDAVAVVELDDGGTVLRALLGRTGQAPSPGYALTGVLSVWPVGDVDGDGLADYVALGRSGTVGNLVFGPTGAAVPLKPLTDVTASSAAAIGDIDGDGFDDFAVVGISTLSSGSLIWVYRGAPDLSTRTSISTFVPVPGLSSADQASGLAAVGDVNGDGFGDFVVGGTTAGGQDFPRLFLGGPSSIRTGTIDLGISSAPNLTCGGRTDGTRIELLMQEEIGPSVRTVGRRLQLDGTSDAGADPYGAASDYGAIGDFDGDGRIDVAATYQAGANLAPLIVYTRPTGSGPLPTLLPADGGPVEATTLARYPPRE